MVTRVVIFESICLVDDRRKRMRKKSFEGN